MGTYQLREVKRKDLSEIKKWKNFSEMVTILGNHLWFGDSDIEGYWLEDYMGERSNTVKCDIIRGGTT